MSDKAHDTLFQKYHQNQTEPVPVKKLAAVERSKKKAEVKRERKKRLVKYGANRMLSPEDKQFTQLLAEGRMSKTKAYIKAYDIVLPPKATEQYAIERARVKARAAAKTRSDKIARAIKDSEAKIDEIYTDSLEMLHDIVLNGRSEKVRAEVGIEFVRQKRGAPTTKIKDEGGSQTVVIMVGEQPAPKVSDSNKYYVEGEVVETTSDNANIIATDDGLDGIVDVVQS